MKKRIAYRRPWVLKTTAVFLLCSFGVSQLTYAADPRELLLQAKSGFELEDQRRSSFEDALFLADSESLNQAAVDQSNDLQDLERANFSLTTQSGDVLKYVGNVLDEIQRLDGTTLRNITLNSQGLISGADLKLFDGSLQVFQNGSVLAHRTPDGTEVYYENGRVQKTISINGLETTYTYVLAEDGSVIETILDSVHHRSVYDGAGKLQTVFDKTRGERIFYRGGFLSSIQDVDGLTLLFKKEGVGGSFEVSADKYLDKEGNEFFSETEYVLADGSFLKNITWDDLGHLKDATLDKKDGSRFDIIGGRITQIRVPGAGTLSDIEWDSAIGQIKNGLLTDETGVVFTYLNGSLDFVILPDGSRLSSLVWGSSGEVRDALLNDGNGNVYVFKDGRLSSINLPDGSILSGLIWSEAGTVTSVEIRDSKGNRHTYRDGEVFSILLTDGSFLSDIRWDTAGNLSDAAILFPDNSRHIYKNKALIESRVGGITYFYTTTPQGVVVNTSEGIRYEYLSDKTPVKTVYKDGSVTEWIATQSLYRGLPSKSTSSSGIVSIYDYQTTSSGQVRVQKRNILNTLYNQTTITSETAILRSNKPLLKLNVFFPMDGSMDQSVYATAVQGTSKNLKIGLIPGQTATLTYNGVSKSLGIDIVRGVNYVLEIAWQSSGIAIYAYDGSRPKPSQPQLYVSDSSWNPVLSATSTNASILLDPATTSSPNYKRTDTVSDKLGAYQPSEPLMLANFRFLSNSSSNKIILKASQTRSGNLTRTLTFSYSQNRWTVVTSDYDSVTRRTMNTTAYFNQSLIHGQDYAVDFRIEGGKANLYVYPKGQVRPPVASASLSCFSVPTKLEGSWTNAVSLGQIQNSLESPSADSLRAVPLTSRYDYMKNSVVKRKMIPTVQKRSLPPIVKPVLTVTGVVPKVSRIDISKLSERVSFNRLVYSSSGEIERFDAKDGTVLFFEEGLPIKALDGLGRETSLVFEQSSLGHLLGSKLIQGDISSSYDSYGRLVHVRMNGVTIHYRRDQTIEKIEKEDGVILKEIIFDDQGNILDCVILTVVGDERIYRAKQIVSEKKSDGTVTEYLNGKPSITRMADGRVYQYQSVSTADGEVSRGTLFRYLTRDGSGVTLENGMPSKIQTRAGMVLTGLGFNAKGDLSEATATFTGPDGNLLELAYRDGEVKTIISSDGSRMFYENNLLRSAIEASGRTVSYEYEFDDSGKMSQIILKDSLGKRFYTPAFGQSRRLADQEFLESDGSDLDLANPYPPMDFLSYFQSTENTSTHLPVSHVNSSDSLTISYTYDMALYVLAGAENTDLVLDYYINHPEKTLNSTSTPKGGIYSDISTLGGQAGFNRYDVVGGPNAWIGLAAVKRYAKTGDTRYLDFAKARANFLKSLWDPIGKGLVMGPWPSNPTPYYNLKSAENNLSALYLFESLYRETGDSRYSDFANDIWSYVKSLYDPVSHFFSRGEHKDSQGMWVRDTISFFATDVLAWIPFERVLGDSYFGETLPDRLLEIEAMTRTAEKYTGIFSPVGEMLGYSYSPESKDNGIISIEWSSQMAIFYLKLARAFQEIGNDTKYRFYGARYKKIVDSMEGFFRHADGGGFAAPYAVYKDGSGAYGKSTGHGWSTPSPKVSGEETYSIASIYYQFARQKRDPLTGSDTSLLQLDLVSSEDVDRYKDYYSKPPETFFDVVTSLVRYENEKYTATYDKGILKSIEYENVRINDPIIDSRGFLVAGEIHLPSGEIYTLRDRKVVSVKRVSGTTLEYEGDLVVGVTTPQGKKVRYHYTMDSTSRVTDMRVEYDAGSGWIQKSAWDYFFDPANTEEKPIAVMSYMLSSDNSRRGYVYASNPAGGSPVWAGDAKSISSLVDPETRLVFDSTNLQGGGDRLYMDISVYRFGQPYPNNIVKIGDDSFLSLKAKQESALDEIGVRAYWMTTNSTLEAVPLAPENGIALTENYQDHVFVIRPEARHVNRDSAYLRLLFDTPLSSSETWKISLAELKYFKINREQPTGHLPHLLLSSEDMTAIDGRTLANDFMDLLDGSSLVPAFNHMEEAENFLVSMDVSGEYGYISGTRADGTIERYSSGKVESLTRGEGEESYEYDENGQVKSVTSRDRSTGEIKTITEYQYGRIRRVKNASGDLLYTYKYELDSEKEEATLVRDERAGETRHYTRGRLLFLDNADGTRTHYYYENSDDRISRSVVLSGEKNVLREFFYTYEGENTLMRDDEGITRVYDKAQKLISLITPRGLEYRYRHLVDGEGNSVEEQFLYSAKTPDGVTLFYKEDTVEKILLKDGTILYVNEETESLYQDVLIKEGLVEQVSRRAGETAQYVRDVLGRLKEVRVTRDGQSYRYTSEGRLISRVDSTGSTYHYGYLFDALGNIDKVRVVKRIPKPIGGVLPPIDPDTGKFPVFSVLSAGYIDGWNASLTANEQGVGTFRYNFWDPSTSKWLGRGYDVAVLDPKGNLVKADLFDVYSLGEAEADRMARFIEQVPQDYFVIMAIADEGLAYMTPRAYQAIESLGSASIQSLGFRGSWGLIGRKGASFGTAVESLKPAGKGHVFLQSHETEYSYYDKNGTPLRYDQFAPVLSNTWRGSYQSYVGDSVEILKEEPDEYALSYHKNFNEFYPRSGFLQLWNDRYLNTYPVQEYANQLIQMTSGISKRYVYYDGRYPFNFTHPLFGKALKDILAQSGFEVLDADGLASVMKSQGSDTVVVSAHDVMPDTVYDPNSPYTVSRRKLVRTYMENGGLLAWMGDIPFYYVGHADKTKDTLGESGARNVLGVTPLTRDVTQPVQKATTSRFDASTSDWTLSGGALIHDGVLALSPADVSVPAKAVEYLYTSMETRLGYAAELKTISPDSDFLMDFEVKAPVQSALEFQNIQVYHEGGVLKIRDKKRYRPGNGYAELVVTQLGSLAIEPAVAYNIEINSYGVDTEVYIYPKGEARPEVPLVRLVLQLSRLARLSVSSSLGQAEMDTITKNFIGYEPISIGDRSGQSPNFGLDGEEASLDQDILYYDTNVNFRTVRWDKVRESIGYSLDPDTAIISSYNHEGDLVAIAKADRSVTYYKNGKVQQVSGVDGEILVDYEYDEAGNLLNMKDLGRRRKVGDGILDAKVKAGIEKIFDLEDLAISNGFVEKGLLAKVARIRSLARNAHAIPNISNSRASIFHSASLVIQQRAESLNGGQTNTSLEEEIGGDPFFQQIAEAYSDFGRSRQQAGSALREVESIKLHWYSGKNAHKEKDNKIREIQDIIREIDRQEQIYSESVSHALADYSAAIIVERRLILESDYARAFDALDLQAQELEKSIQKEESIPIITHYYRAILGRDPTRSEIESYFPQVEGQGRIDSQALAENLRNSSGFIERTARANRIRGEIEDSLDRYMSAGDEEKDHILESLGLAPSETVELSSQDIQAIKNFLISQGLHFGESATQPLLELLRSKGIEPDPDDASIKLVLIDIFTGVLHPYLKEGEEMLLSLHALKKVASLYGLDTEALSLSYEDLLVLFSQSQGGGSESSLPKKVLLHTEGSHYTTLVGVGVDSVTLLEYNGDIITLSKEDFLKGWEGVALVDKSQADSLLAGEFSSAQARILTPTETHKIKGSFFLILATIYAAISTAISAIGSLLVIIGNLVAQLGTLIGNILHGLGSFLYNVTQSIAGVMRNLWSGIKYVGMKVFSGFAKVFVPTATKAVAGETLKLSVGQAIANSAVKVGIGYITSRGLEALGVNPVVSSIISSFVTGGIHGGFSAQGLSLGFNIADGLKAGLQLGAKTFLQSAGLDSDLAGLLSLTAGPLTDGFWQGDIAGSLISIAPNLSLSLAGYGIDKLSSSLGLPPLVGQAFTNAVFNTLNSAYQGGVDVGQNIISSVQEGLLQTAISYGISFARDAISDPLLGSLASRALAGAIEGALFQKNLFQGMYEAAKQSVLDLFGRNKQDLLSNITDFVTLISEKGSLSAAFEAYATQIFDRTTLESVLRSGGFTSALLSPKQNILLPTGVMGKESILSNGTSVLFNSQGAFIGFKRQGVTQIGTFGITNTGTFGLIEGRIYGLTGAGNTYSGIIKDGQAIDLKIEVDDNEIKLTGKDGHSIVFDQEGQMIEGNIQYSQASIDFFINFIISQGFAESVEGSASGTVDSVRNIHYIFGNGFNNEVVPEGTKDGLIQPLINLLALKDKVISLIQAVNVTMYETTALIGNALNWISNFWTQWVSNETIRNFIDAMNAPGDFFENLVQGIIPQSDIPSEFQNWTEKLKAWYHAVVDPFTNHLVDEVIEKLTVAGVIEDAIAFSHSGFFSPLLGAIERMDYDVHTLINYEGPYLDPNDYLESSHLKRIINVWGTAPNDPFINGQSTGYGNGRTLPAIDSSKKPVSVGDFGPPFMMDDDRLANFTSTGGVVNVNIKILGARHNDFSYKEYKSDVNGNDLAHTPENELWNRDPYEPEQIAREINFKTNVFMRNLYRAVKEEDQTAGRINAFFLDLQSRDVAYQEGNVWVVDAKALPYALEYAY